MLAEKPSVAKDIAKVLKCDKRDGVFENNQFIVTWALGHLVTLADPEQYGDQYKSWKLIDLPIMPKKLELVTIKQTAKQYNMIKSQLNRKDVTGIIIATDSGREGELVARWIIKRANINKPIKRLWISSVTDKAIKDGFSNLKEGRLYENLFKSAEARAEADWFVGINATRALTTKFNAQLSCGRVQTPTLYMIAKREEEIRSFKPKKYYGITASAGDLQLTWQDRKTKDTKTFEKEYVDEIYQKIKNKDAKIIEISKTLKKVNANELYNLTQLQIDANKMFDFSAKETLSIMQTLYESYKVLTYPRTDSKYLTTDIVATIPERLIATGYNRLTEPLLKTKITAKSHFVDNNKVSDHHAIIPTEQRANINLFTDKERKIYDLVVKRFLAVLYPPFEFEETTIKFTIGEEIFSLKGNVVINKGWKAVYGNESSDDDLKNIKIAPSLNKGDTLKIASLKITEGLTKPPSLFNEATLLASMENPIHFMNSQDKELSKILGETGGLGTVATRADIIEKLFSSFVIEKKGKDISITSKGKQLLELVPKELKSPELTAKWEQKLIQIQQGKTTKESFMEEIRKYTDEIIKIIKNSDEKFRHDNITGNKCPDCGKYLLEVNGKKGKMLVCQDMECGYRKGVSIITNARCPKCHKKLELIGEGEKKKFICGTCGYKESYQIFEARKSKEKSAMSKKELESFMKNQKENDKTEVNNPFASQLANFNFKK